MVTQKELGRTTLGARVAAASIMAVTEQMLNAILLFLLFHKSKNPLDSFHLVKTDTVVSHNSEVV